MNSSTPSPQTFDLNALDGYPLKAQCYSAQGTLHGRLIVAGATGVAQRFYARFAQFAAGQGIEVWTLDYRGIGLSRPGDLRQLRMRYTDWATQDLGALLQHVRSLGDAPIWMVGHSYGGHAFAQIPGHEQVQRFATFATGAGWHGWMPPLERLRVLFLWRVLGPLIVRRKGYLAWSALGMGEDLPADVFHQWRHWCQWPRYFFDDPAMAHLKDRFAAVRTPIRAINASDDLWALPASRDAFMSAYSGAPVETVTVEPRSLGLKSIGHMGYFRPQAERLWQETLDWLRQV